LITKIKTMVLKVKKEEISIFKTINEIKFNDDLLNIYLKRIF